MKRSRLLTARAVFLWASVLWSFVYLYLFCQNTELIAPFATVWKFPLILYFSEESVRFYLYTALAVAVFITLLISAMPRFSNRVSLLVLPVFALLVDLYGEISCTLSAFSGERELYSSYYLYNRITPTPGVYYILMGVWDLLLLVALLFPVFRRKQKEIPAAEERVEGITTDNWDEILSDPSACHEVEKDDKSGKPGE